MLSAARLGQGMEEIAHSPDDFAAGFEAAFARFQVHVEDACAAADGWPAKISAAIRAAFEFAAADPRAADTLSGEALAGGLEGNARYQRLLAYIGRALAPGRAECPHGGELPELTEQMLAGGLVSLVASRLDRGAPGDLPELVPDAIQFTLTPYLGAEEARRRAARCR